jgi:methylated-DNA-[protein]-cysteine S-methyltransferase
MRSPLGRIEVGADHNAIVSLAIEGADGLPHDHLDENTNGVLELALGELSEYFDGQRREFDVPVRPLGTPFQLAVWQKLQDVPWGECVSYGDLGRATGRESAGRAIGGAVARNPIPVIVPCHRVLASGRRITGYSPGRGVPTKMWLLDHEAIGFIA